MFRILPKEFDTPIARRLVYAFWIALAVSYYVQDVLSFIIRGGETHWQQALIYTNGWLIWLIATPLVIKLAQRYPIKKEQLTQSILWHVLLGFGVTTVIFIIESVITWWLYKTFFYPPSVLQRWFGDTLYKTTLNLVIYFFIVVVVQIIQAFIDNQKVQQQAAELKAQLSSARLQTLKMQLNPHFLFNTHNAIISFLHRNESETGINMLLKLSDMLRLTLETKADLIPLSKEIEIIHLFLDIQKIRFGERLQVSINIENAVNECLMPTFFLQPLVENAIEHGIAPVSDAGVLTINATKKDNKLVITIEDDGVGYAEKENRQGIGLTNTIERLKQLYDEQYVFSIEKKHPKGSIVTIEIPIIVMSYER